MTNYTRHMKLTNEDQPVCACEQRYVASDTDATKVYDWTDSSACEIHGRMRDEPYRGSTIATSEGIIIAETRHIDARDYAEGITDEHGIHLGTREEYESGAFADE